MCEKAGCIKEVGGEGGNALSRAKDGVDLPLCDADTTQSAKLAIDYLIRLNLSPIVRRHLDQQEQDRKSSASQNMLGLDLSVLTDALRKQYKVGEKVKGVLITAVDPHSEAANKHLAPGMVISQAQHDPVMTPTEVKRHIEWQKEASKRALVLLL